LATPLAGLAALVAARAAFGVECRVDSASGFAFCNCPPLEDHVIRSGGQLAVSIDSPGIRGRIAIQSRIGHGRLRREIGQSAVRGGDRVSVAGSGHDFHFDRCKRQGIARVGGSGRKKVAIIQLPVRPLFGVNLPAAIIRGIARAARIPMITTTIINSISVKPPCPFPSLSAEPFGMVFLTTIA